MIKRVLLVLCACLLLFPALALAEEEEREDFEQTLQQEMDKIDLNSWQSFYEQNSQVDILEGKSVKDMAYELASGEGQMDSRAVFNLLISLVLKGLKENLGIMSMVAFIAILCSIITKFQTDSLGNVSEVARYACFLLIMTTLLNILYHYTSLAGTAITRMEQATRMIFPPLLTLMTALGGIASAGIFRPAMAVLCGSMMTFTANVVLPISVFGGTTSVIGGISRHIQVKKLSELAGSLCKWLLGIAFTVFIGILSIQGMMASTFDGVYLRTAKYAVDSFVPVIGGMMSDTVDTIMGCSLLIKNSLGFTGLLILAGVVLSPLISIAAGIFCYRLLAALLETVAEEKTAEAISGIAAALTTLFIIVLVVASMTFITITLAVQAGNTNMMLR